MSSAGPSTDILLDDWDKWQEDLLEKIHEEPLAKTITICSAVLTSIVAGCHAVSHLRRYTRPRLQRHVVRIIFMAPIYAVCSCITLQTGVVELDVVRDVYEAWVIHNFLAILFEVLGGEAAIANRMQARPRVLPTSWFWGTCCIDPVWPGRISFLKFCKGGTLQFALLKPVLAVAQLLMQWNDVYGEGHYLSFDRGFVYLSFLYNVSITVAIYALVLFYLAMRDELSPFRPVLK